MKPLDMTAKNAVAPPSQDKRVKVSVFMCDIEDGGFVTGISKTADLSKTEFERGKHKELIKGIKLIKGCYWSYSYEWYKT